MDMLDQLFSSRVRAKILEALFYSPGTTINAYQLTHSIGESYNAVWKELVRLESIGVLKSVRKGKTKEYSINPFCSIIEELRSMVLKTKGIGRFLHSQVSSLGTIRAAFIFGSYAAGSADEKSDIDLFLIGQVDMLILSELINQSELKIQRPINYITMTFEEWTEKKERQDPFIINLLNSPKIFLIGDENGL